MITQGDAEHRDVLVSDLGDPASIEDRFRSVDDWVKSVPGYGAAFPTFHEATYGGNRFFGVILIKDSVVEHRDVLASELGDPQTVEERFRAVDDWARQNTSGFGAAFPTFQQSGSGSNLVFGIQLIRASSVTHRDEYRAVLDFASWPFDSTFSVEQRRIAIERHVLAYNQIRQCSRLSSTEIDDLLNAYSRIITHGVNTNPVANASAIVGGNNIFINLTNFYALTPDEQAQTMIHEMMHCANYTHPQRQNTDVPGDNGSYYGTPPLQAEICISGTQSLTAVDTHCEIEDGVATIFAT